MLDINARLLFYDMFMCLTRAWVPGGGPPGGLLGGSRPKLRGSLPPTSHFRIWSPRRRGGSFFKEKYENSTLNKETREIRVFLIYSYFSLKMLSDVFDCFWLLFWSRSCLKSSGRLLGKFYHKIPAYNLEIMYPPYDLILI